MSRRASGWFTKIAEELSEERQGWHAFISILKLSENRGEV